MWEDNRTFLLEEALLSIMDSYFGESNGFSLHKMLIDGLKSCGY